MLIIRYVLSCLVGTSCSSWAAKGTRYDRCHHARPLNRVPVLQIRVLIFPGPDSNAVGVGCCSERDFILFSCLVTFPQASTHSHPPSVTLHSTRADQQPSLAMSGYAWLCSRCLTRSGKVCKVYQVSPNHEYFSAKVPDGLHSKSKKWH